MFRFACVLNAIIFDLSRCKNDKHVYHLTVFKKWVLLYGITCVLYTCCRVDKYRCCTVKTRK